MKFQESVDVVVIGSGQAGLVASTTAACSGASVMLIEARDTFGGTAAKSSGAMWIPNNRFMREHGQRDSREDSLRYMARLNHPATFAPRNPTLGLPTWEYEGISNFFDHASRALDHLLKIGALDVVPDFEFVDYYAHLEENKAATGRTIFPRPGHGELTGGAAATKLLFETGQRAGVEFRSNCHVVELVAGEEGVSGIIVEAAGSQRTAVEAKGGVIFATGGFSRDESQLRRHTHLPYGPGCAVSTNTGKFLSLAVQAGAQCAGMDLAWGAPIVLERAIREPDTVCASFYFPGDGFIIVDQRGRRIVNEKAPYNELVRAFFDFDSHSARYMALPMLMIWDEEQNQLGAPDRLGNPFLGAHSDPYWMVSGSDLEELTANLRNKLVDLQHAVPGAALSTDFTSTLLETVSRYNRHAVAGSDPDFHRGATPYEIAMAKRMGPGSGPNPTMRPLAQSGPFYATVLTPAAFDTKGGPLTDGNARVIGHTRTPIEGLYAAGNCAASPTGQSYWSGGTSLALAMTSGFVAAEHAVDRARGAQSTAATGLSGSANSGGMDSTRSCGEEGCGRQCSDAKATRKVPISLTRPE